MLYAQDDAEQLLQLIQSGEAYVSADFGTPFQARRDRVRVVVRGGCGYPFTALGGERVSRGLLFRLLGRGRAGGAPGIADI